MWLPDRYDTRLTEAGALGAREAAEVIAKLSPPPQVRLGVMKQLSTIGTQRQVEAVCKLKLFRHVCL